jgi:hypothetical protein
VPRLSKTTSSWARESRSTTCRAEILGEGAIDLDGRGAVLRLEASCRLSSHWKQSVESWIFLGIPAVDSLYPLRQDDFLRVEVARYF